jgi:uncharacterized protein YqeY
MGLYKQILDEAKAAMIAKDSLRLNTLRGVKAAFTNELLAKPELGAELPDELALTIVRRLVKQRKDSIEQFQKGGREDLANAEAAELKVLESYLPAMIGSAEIKTIAERKIKELGVTDKTKLGQLIGAVMKEARGQADGGEVKKIVEALFQ